MSKLFNPAAREKPAHAQRKRARAVMRAALLLPFLWAAPAAPAGADEGLWEKITRDGHFAIIRHALAPGYGDPENFRIGDCATQRNLDAFGREQARRIGERFREKGIRSARVYSSQWCRCVDTARLLGLGPVKTLPSLNSLYGRPEDAANMKSLRAFLSFLERTGPPVVLVSHQATMRALTGRGAASGEIIVFRIRSGGGIEAAGSIPPRDRQD